MLIKAWTLNSELKEQQFWATLLNRKWTFCFLGPWLWPNYQANHLHESKDRKQYKFSSIKGYWEGNGLTSGWCSLLKNSLLIKLPNVTFRVVKSSRLPVKIAAYLVSISRLLCLAFLYGWRFWNKISLDWPLTLTTQPSTCTSKLSDNPKHCLPCWTCDI